MREIASSVGIGFGVGCGIVAAAVVLAVGAVVVAFLLIGWNTASNEVRVLDRICGRGDATCREVAERRQRTPRRSGQRLQSYCANLYRFNTVRWAECLDQEGWKVGDPRR